MAAAKQPKAVIAARGKFITLEGVDGAGKSTHIPWIAERLRTGGREVIVTREPGGTPLAEKLRERVLTEAMDPVTETRLMFEARADHVRAVIAPALARGAWVVCDRFTDSTVAYQGAGKGVDRKLIEELAGETHPGLRPDLTLVFDSTYAVSSQRLGASGRQPDRFTDHGPHAQCGSDEGSRRTSARWQRRRCLAVVDMDRAHERTAHREHGSERVGHPLGNLHRWHPKQSLAGR